MRPKFPRCCLYIFLLSLPAFAQQFAKANGISIAYESFGPPKSETIVLISGTGAQLSMWPAEFCEKLVKKGYRVIRFDNRDIGLSTKLEAAGMPDWAAISKALTERTPPPLPYSLDDMAKDVVGLLDALNIEKAHIAGASMGGMIAQRVAYNHPDRVLSLASIMAAGGDVRFPMVAKPEIVGKIPEIGPDADKSVYIAREIQSRTLLAGNRFIPDEKKLKQQVEKDLDRSFYPMGLYRQGAASMAGFYAGRQAQLKAIKVPTVVIHGSEDPLVVVEAAKDVAACIPGAEFKLLEGMGHDLPEALFDTIAELISKNAKKHK